MARDYKDTCLLPQTAFTMKADLYQREPLWLERWKTMDLYAKILARDSRNSTGSFVFHDGPPYANGRMHYGHILNNALKDFVTRSRNMLGERTKFVPGWDCHGLPIELNVDRSLSREDPEALASPAHVRRECRAEALRWVEVQRKERARLGVLGTWDAPYLTMNPAYESAVIRCLKAFVSHGLVYRGRKPVSWCWQCRTALAEAEVEYAEEHISPSVYVKFELDAASTQKLRELSGTTCSTLYAVIWTTTPWTLAANLAIALHPEREYVVLARRVGSGVEGLLVARPLAENLARALKLTEPVISAPVPGHGLVGLVARHPFEDRASPFLAAEYVDMQTGTGLVHTAPGHGRDDYKLGRAHGLAAYAPVDDSGRYDSLLGEGAKALKLQGVHVFDADSIIEKALADRALLLHSPGQTLRHKYPLCWRCKSPLITRATDQWFIALDEPMKGLGEGAPTLRQKALSEINRLAEEGKRADEQGSAQGWIPAWGKERIHGMVEGRPDWCISRQRVWGVPIPSVRCAKCEGSTLTAELLDHVATLFAERGADAWYDPEATVLPKGFACEHCKNTDPEGFTRDQNIIDVWFESGSSFMAVCGQDPELGTDVNLYLEGSDQHRGWFHSSLLVGCAVLGRSPFRAVLTHGFVCDDRGRPYSKSDIRRRQESRCAEIVHRVQSGESLSDVLLALKSTWSSPEKRAEAHKRLARKEPLVELAALIATSDIEYIEPDEIIKTQGAELFRAWAASIEFESDIALSRKHISQATDSYRRIRNTLRFMLGTLRNEDAPRVSDVPLEALDRWALTRLSELVAKCERCYRRYEFRGAFALVVDFTQELSGFYLDVSKDWLYNDPRESPRRRSALATVAFTVRAVALLIAPILPFSAEDVWDHLPPGLRDTESVHLGRWPIVPESRDGTALHSAMKRMRALRDGVNAALEPVVQLWGVEKQLAKKLNREPGGVPEEKRVDHIRDASIDLSLPREHRAELGAFESHLAEILGVGTLRVSDGEGFNVGVVRAEHAPCDRCWKRRGDVGAGGLCARCDDAVRRLGLENVQ